MEQEQLRKEIQSIGNRVGVLAQYLPPTDFKGARVRVSLPRAGEEPRELACEIGFDHSWSSASEVAAAWIHSRLGLLPFHFTQALAASGGNDMLIYVWFRSCEGGEENRYTLIKELIESEREAGAAEEGEVE